MFVSGFDYICDIVHV